MISVAYLVPSLQAASGWRTHACSFLRAISRFVAPVLYVASSDADAAAALFPDWPRRVLPAIQRVAFRNVRSVPRIVAARWRVATVQVLPVDIVHSLEAYPTGLVGSWLAERAGRPHVITGHGTYAVNAHASCIDRVAYASVLRGAAAFCPVSTGTARLVREYFPAATAGLSLRAVLNGNDYFQQVPRIEALDRRSPAVPTVLSVGAIKPRKGYHVSLAAFARLKRRVPAARYWIVGRVEEPRYFETLRSFVEQEHVQDVHFLEALPEEALRQRYRDASLFLLAPQQVGLSFEGFGLVFLEAGAHGLAVVATRTGGVPDAVRDGTTGLLADPSDVEGLATALERLLTNQELAARMGRANREWSETLTWERCANQYVEVYERVLAGERDALGSES